MKRLLAPLVLLFAAGCGPIFFVEADLPEVCKTFTDQQFPAAPIAAALDMTFPSQSYDFSSSIPSILTTGNKLTGSLKVLHVTLTAKSGINDFDFVDAAKLDLLPGSGSTLPPLSVVNYVRDPKAPPQMTIDLVDPSQPDVFKYLISGQLTTQHTISGTAPTVDWSVDVKVCVSADAKYQYL